MSILLTPNTTVLGRALRLPLKLLPRDTVVRVRSGLNEGMKWRVGANTHGCWLGTYELVKQQIVRELVRPGMNVFDIGANAGFYTLAFSRLVGSRGHVWAVEPFAENVGNLSLHLELNETRNVTLIQSAIAAGAGMANFQSSVSNSMGKLTRETTNLIVPTVSLDQLIESGIPPPDIVKIDIEGGELAALQGASRLLSLRRTIWLIALDDRNTNSDCRQILLEAGYEVSNLGSNDNEIVARKAAA